MRGEDGAVSGDWEEVADDERTQYPDQDLNPERLVRTEA